LKPHFDAWTKLREEMKTKRAAKGGKKGKKAKAPATDDIDEDDLGN
jgi:hypothetical protein